jgi:hypothetical protein
MKRKSKPLMLSRDVKTKQQTHREVELRGASFQTLAKWQSDYYKLSGKGK